jgi:hypothetical protein
MPVHGIERHPATEDIMTIHAALERLGMDLLVSDDFPIITVCVTIYADRAPDIHIAALDRDIPLNVADFRDRDPDGVDEPEQTQPLWGVAQLTEAGETLSDYTRSVRYSGSWEGAHERAQIQWARRREAELTRAVKADQERLAKPHQCSRCGRRFATQGPLTTHQKRCTSGRGKHREMGSRYGVNGEVDAQCCCGEWIHGANRREAEIAMAAHITACETTEEAS